MDWLIGEQVGIHPIGKSPEESILSGIMMQANDIVFLLVTDQGSFTQLTWATTDGYQITAVIAINNGKPLKGAV